MVESRHSYWVAIKHVLRYLHGTIGYGMRYVLGFEVRIHVYNDFDCEGSAMDKNNTLGYYFSL
jgi:hypothetical protein